MAQSLPVNPPETRLNTVQVRMAKAGTAVNAAEPTAVAAVSPDLLSLIQIAIRRAGLKQDYLAALAGVKPSQLSGALNGHGAFNVCWLASWPRSFWNELNPLLRAETEDSPAAKTTQRVARLVHAIELLLLETV